MSMSEQLLSRFREALMMDEQWSVQTNRVLQWWGGPQPLVIHASEDLSLHGDRTVKITAQVDLFEMASDSAELSELMNLRNTISSTGALIFVPEAATVRMFCTYFAHAGNESMTLKFPAFALMMYTEALALAQLPELAELCGPPANPAHPESGQRSDFDELINFTDEQIVPVGTRPSRWTSADGNELEEILANAGLMSQRDDAALTIKTPFLDAPLDEAHTLIDLDPRAEHPNYGSGLLAIVQLPPALPSPLAIRIGQLLNTFEYDNQTGQSASGAWCAMRAGDSGTSILAHDQFLPNYFYEPGWMTYLGVASANRAAWAAGEIAELLERFVQGT